MAFFCFRNIFFYSEILKFFLKNSWRHGLSRNINHKINNISTNIWAMSFKKLGTSTHPLWCYHGNMLSGLFQARFTRPVFVLIKQCSPTMNYGLRHKVIMAPRAFKTTRDVINFNAQTWISQKWKKISQKRKCHSYSDLKAFQISKRNFLLHMHLTLNCLRCA